MAAAEPSPAVGAVTIDADEIEIEGGFARGSGDVHAVFGDRQVEAVAFVLDTQREVLMLQDGVWSTDLGAVRFSEAEVDLAGVTGVLLDARYTDTEGRVVVSAGTVQILDDNEMTAEDAWISLCRCADPPWSVEAREVEVVADDVARFKGGWIRICKARVVPVPRGAVPIADRRTGLLPPSVGWGRDGVTAQQPVMVVLGPHADALVAPEIRAERGVRGLGELRYSLGSRAGGAGPQGGQVRGAFGEDLTVEENRGVVDVEHGWTPGIVRTGIDAQWATDPDYLADYADSFLARSAPWSESLGVVGVGPVRVETDRFQGAEALPQRWFGVVASSQGRRLGPVALGGGVRADGVGVGVPGAWSAGHQQRVQGRVQAWTGRNFGPVLTGVGASGRLTNWVDAVPWWTGSLSSGVGIPLWGDIGGGRHVAEVGVMGQLTGQVGEADVRLLDDRTPPAWGVGPAVSSRWLTPVGVPVSARGVAPWTARGWRPRGAVQLSLPPVSVSTHANRQVQSLRLVRDDGIWRSGIGVAHGGPLLQGAGDLGVRLPAPADIVQVGWRGLAELRTGELLAQGPFLALASRCDCLSGTAAATWSADREVPDVQITVDLR